ncbi:MAG: methylmalonyl-CoA mutase small subunit [Prevotellaceae bacterium]|nr:methylmalonyl-CoA mutase small subunit [Prevotellaceae bacterium]
MSEKKLSVSADFPAVSTDEWMAKITADLKGADFQKKLVWKTHEGFDVMPFYRAADLKGLASIGSAPGVFPYVRGTKTDNVWFVRQNITVSDVGEANRKALDSLNKGVDSLGFQLGETALTDDSLKILLNNIQADCVELNFEVCITKSEALVTLLLNYFKAQKYDIATLRGSINCDPVNRMLLKGKALDEVAVKEIIVAVAQAGKALPNYRVIGINPVSINNAGAYCAQELGYALAWGTQYLTWLTEAGFPVDDAAKALKFNFGIGGNYFMEIAKFRAARLLWAKIVEAYKPEDLNAAKMVIHAETSRFNKTIFDAHVNMLRTQTEAMSASIAGVDSLTVLPFDAVFKESNEFSERIARNQQLLLKEETHLDKITDVSAGSYYIETLTDSIAAKAWARFLDIENQGGLFALVTTGAVQKDMQASAAKRLRDVSSRREVLLGTNQYPNFSETASQKLTPESACACSVEAGLDTLPHVRAAQEFEALRFATEHAAKRPKAFMLTIGNLAMRLARAQFSCNFFACAGYEVIDNLGFSTVEEGVAAAQKADADIIVLCSSDDEYAELAPAAYKVIGGKQLFVVAGAPECADALKAVGIEHFINVKVNVLDTLKGFNSKIGI